MRLHKLSFRDLLTLWEGGAGIKLGKVLFLYRMRVVFLSCHSTSFILFYTHSGNKCLILNHLSHSCVYSFLSIPFHSVPVHSCSRVHSAQVHSRFILAHSVGKHSYAFMCILHRCIQVHSCSRDHSAQVHSRYILAHSVGVHSCAFKCILYRTTMSSTLVRCDIDAEKQA